MDTEEKIKTMILIAVVLVGVIAILTTYKADTNDQKNFCIQEFKTNAVKYDKCINF